MQIKNKLRLFFEVIIFKKKHVQFGKIVNLKNIKYIKAGKNVRIKNYFKIECLDIFYTQTLKPELIIGDNVIIGDFFTACITEKCIIGEDTIIAHNVTILTENHGINPLLEIPYHMQNLTNKPIIIGKNCWIGANVVILPGTVLGDNCIVGANSVVNKKIPSNSLIVGAPAKIVKIFDNRKGIWIKYNDN